MLQGDGLIIAISSVASYSPSVSGAAYSAAKAGLNMLSGYVNTEEGVNGIRSCIVAPGEIDTPIMDDRPVPPTPEQRSRMLRAEDIAEIVVSLVRQPRSVLTNQVVVRPRMYTM